MIGGGWKPKAGDAEDHIGGGFEAFDQMSINIAAGRAICSTKNLGPR
jgi:hypothetical protein